MTGLILLPTDRLPTPTPRLPPGVDQAATLLYVAAFGMLAVGLGAAVVAGLVARQHFRQGQERGATAVGGLGVLLR